MATWFLFCSLSIIPFLFILHQIQKNKKPLKNHPPGPPRLPFIGNLHQFDAAKPHEFLRNLSNKYGPLMSLKLGSVQVLVISSAEAAKEALKSHDLMFSGRPPLTSHRKYSYDGLDVGFAPYGEQWREMRKLTVVHLLSAKRVQSFRPILEEEVSILIKQISDRCSDEVINLSSLLMNLTNTLICRIAFGKKYDDRDHEKKKRFDRILVECQAMFAGFFVSDYLPSLRWIDKLSGMLARLEKNFHDLDLFYEVLIEDHLNPQRPDSMKDDVLDLMIQIKEKQLLPFEFTWSHIKAMLMDIFVAGTDTSAAVIIWAMTALMQNTNVMKKVQSEIRDIVRKRGTINEEVLQELPYLDSIIKETFRLYPPMPVIMPRETTQDFSIEGYDIETKTMVFINAWAISKDPQNWENPLDFIPERFLNNNVDVKGNDFQLIPFGAGRRGCPGISQGLETVKVTLTNLLCSFDWELPQGMRIEAINIDILPGLTMHKKVPLCLVAKKVN